ncbi:MAG: response regulator [Candidatus Thiodiazotropha sp. (ex Lucinoma borealis)]|nr:response regulator [Candidatus Thiodiazotropha sp. (ex Lucinoma borealis)]MCU7870126.1 response regulator [Candidatus Thiodiazotropha sp. (ex Lucinoma borealis)]
MSIVDKQLTELRRQAEKKLQTRQSDFLEFQPEQLANQLHELEVHQIELEMQNVELQRSHIELESVRDRYADLFDFAPVGYLIIDKAGRIVRANLTIAEMLGMNRHQLHKDYFYRLISETHQSDILRHFRHVFKYQTRQTCEVSIVLKDGPDFIAKLDSIIQPGGGVDGDDHQCLTLVSDITEIKKVEAENRTARKAAEVANQTKSHFLAAASHDLRQPLQAMTTINDLLKRKLCDKETLGLVNNLSDCLVNMNDLFNALLNVSQLESGSIKPKINTFPVGELLHRLDTTYRSLAEEKQLKLDLVQCSATIYSDPVLLYQILDNLVSNAIRYTKAGKVLVGCRRRGSMLRFEVWDTGIGIPESQREQIFDEFHQLYNPARDRSKGLGLGLAIAARSACLLGQEIDLRSRENGSLFSVQAPLVFVGSTHEVAPCSSEITGTTAPAVSLLIIDDNSIILRSLSYLMESYGYKVTGMKSGQETMAMIKKGTDCFDFIISDYRLPNGETGIELIKAIRQALGTDIPALIITGDLELTMSQLIEASGLRVLHKPVRAEVLNKQIQELMV